jgi:acetyl esterase/lipase
MKSRHLVDPQLLPVLSALPAMEVSADTLQEWRRFSAAAVIQTEGFDVAVEELWIERTTGGKLRLLRYTPRQDDSGPRAAMVHLHSGGYVLGKPEMGSAFCSAMAALLSCIVVSVDYRLAPEFPYPAQLDDAYTALTWLYDNAAALSVDKRRVAVAGESAGGGLAAALAIAARDRGKIPLIFQLLIYPMLDDLTGSVPGNSYAGEFVWTAASNRFGWHSLLGGAEPGPYAAPARASNLEHLPPAFIAVGSLDLFANENIMYANRLINAGVPVELHVYPGAFHGFPMVPQASASIALRNQWCQAMQRAMATSIVTPHRA